jgi:hypothetical protein
MSAVLMILSGLFVRLVMPILVTALVVLALRSFYRRSQVEGENGEVPCWQAHRLPNGYLHKQCLHCDVFISAPAMTWKPHIDKWIT